MGADIPLLAVRKQIASAIDIIVHLGRLRDRSRRVLEITEVLDCVKDEIQLNTLYSFVEEREEDGRIKGALMKENELRNTDKLLRAGIQPKEL
jgi:pilus assembly protein CpaF